MTGCETLRGRRSLGGGWSAERPGNNIEGRLEGHSVAWASVDESSAARVAARIGLTTKKAVAATTRFAIVATTNTACQLPVWLCNQLAAGTKNAAVPFAV